jgi:phosphate transport system protein
MPVHLKRDIDNLKKKILFLGARVEESLRNSVSALLKRNALMAAEVIEGDVEIDKLEVEIEEDCLKILALYQPVAIDLRFIVAVLKINNDLERVGDLAVNIAKRAENLARKQKIKFPPELQQMLDKSQNMLRLSLDSLVNLDPKTALTVCSLDNEVDDLNRVMYDKLKKDIKNNPDDTTACIMMLTISKFLERIGDQATNIAEDVIYMVEGKIVRHMDL